MDCTEVKNNLWTYLENDQPSDNHFIKEHLSNCSDCNQAMEHLLKMITVLEEGKLHSPNPFFVEKVMNRIVDTQPENITLESLISGWFKVLRPAFATIGIALSIAFGVYLGLPANTSENQDSLDSFAEIYDLRVEESDFIFD